LQAKMRNRYLNSLRYIDSLLGKLLRHTSAMSQDTLIVVTGDHGELFHEHGRVTHGSSLLNPAMSVPVVFYHPGKNYTFSNFPRQLIDIAPTLLELAGLPPHANFQGRSLLELEESPYPVFSSIEGISMKDAVILGRWK